MTNVAPALPDAEAAVSTAELNNTALQEVFDSYCDVRGRERVYANHDLLESLPGAEDQETPVSTFTICVPVAINIEEPERVLRTLSLIARSQQRMGRQIDVVLWTNAKYASDAEQAATTETARQRYDALREVLANSGNHGVQVRTALQVLPEEEATMSKLRANFMDAVAVESVTERLGYDHPVMWLDVDLTGLSKDTLEQVDDAVRHFRGLLVHPFTKYSIDWAHGQTLSETDLATRAVAVSEIIHRQRNRRVMRRYGKMATGTYPEESGLAFAIGTYLLVDGVDTSDPIAESAHLRSRVWERMKAVKDHLQQHGPNASGPPDTAVLPPHLYALYGTNVMQARPVEYLTGVSVTMSGRRQKAVFERQGTAALEREAISYGYELFTQLDSDHVGHQEDVATVAAELRRRIRSSLIEPSHKATDDAIVERYIRGPDA